jgi:hypothetical protein
MQSDAVTNVLLRYGRSGGDPERLKSYLYSSVRKSKTLPDAKSFYSCVAECGVSAGKLLRLHNLSRPIVNACVQFLSELEVAIKTRVLYERGEKYSKEFIKNQRPKGGRPRGRRVSLAFAVIIEEFRQQFGKPQYSDILTLANAADPHEFPSDYSKDKIYKRTVGIPKEQIQEIHAIVFGNLHQKKTLPPRS